MTGYRDLARNHDFTILWTGQTVSELGSQVSMFAFPLVTFAITGSAFAGRPADAALLLGMVGRCSRPGVLADRVRPPPV